MPASVFMKFFSRLLLLCALGAAVWLGKTLSDRQVLSPPWQAADLRALARAEDASLQALLARQQGPGCQIRLDFLNLPKEYRVSISAGGFSYLLSPQTAPVLHLQANPLLDTLTLNLPLCPPDMPLQAQASGEEPLRTTLNAPPVFEAFALPFHLVFYNVFQPAFTPAQALRRWDAAHGGPRGERHGLKGLLDAAEASHTPLVLLDLKDPFALSALDALGVLPQIRRMEAAGLLRLPSVMYTPQDRESLLFSRSASRAFGLDPSLEYFIASPSNFTRPLLPSEELNRQGLALSTRLLLYHALRSREDLSLGGDLALSTWGTGEYASPALAWLAARPYFAASADVLLQPLLSNSQTDSPCSPDPNRLAFWPIGASFPSSELQIAWLMRRSPSVNPALAAVYSANDAWSEVFRWRQNPAAGQGCRGRFCWLASNHFLAFFDLQGGKLTHLWHDEEQLLGPTSQFFVGLSDESQWNVQAGLAADPAQVTGSFAESQAPFRPYRVASLKAGSLRLQAGNVSRTFTLSDAGLQLTTDSPLETLLALTVTPARRFSSGWADCFQILEREGRLGLGWRCGAMAWVQAPAGAILSIESPLAAPALLSSPEDPNRSLPAGFFLPFGVNLLHLRLAAGQSVIIAP